ncbi:chitinase-like protein EN03 [Periplaneta americana]|uniref:chitinase-like protein EN03 n=1 Tax=Periplaneta americana TaxID=6978 RepID=UPI0037E9114F
MTLLWLLNIAVVLTAVSWTESAQPDRVVCYYDSRSRTREGTGKMEAPADIEAALPTCTHLVYGYAVIDSSNHKLVPLDEYQELDSGKGYYRTVTSLKKRYPGLNILLSVGGQADPDKEKYNEVLESEDKRKAFVSSARTLLRQYAFDGLDLAWQFPEIRVKKDRGTFGSLWHSLKKTVGLAHSHKDEKEEEHRTGFTALVKDLKSSLKPDGLLLTAALLSNVDPAAYYEVDKIMPNLDFLSVQAFNYTSPERKPDEADYPAALYQAGGRELNHTADGTIRWFLEKGASASKLILGISSFGQSWKLNGDSKISGVPPIGAEGPGEAGPQTKTPGLLSYPEVCSLLPNPNSKSSTAPHLLRRVSDPSHKLGSYAFRLPDSSAEGLWVAYEDPDTAGYKGAYVKNKGLGGIALWDLSLDDFRGLCSGERFPILKAAKNHL